MLTIKCAKCKHKLFKYNKMGAGRLLHLWPKRIVEDKSVHEGNEVRCRCGNLVGIDEGKFIKMKHRSFTRSGSYQRK